MVHGSRRVESNEAMQRLANELSKNLHNNYDHVALAFLELAEPKIETIVGDFAHKGISEIDIFPYFLAPGNHVRMDIPEIVEGLREKYTGCLIQVLDFLGGSMNWPATVSQCIQSSEVSY